MMREDDYHEGDASQDYGGAVCHEILNRCTVMVMI